jgi:hypothetical protein
MSQRVRPEVAGPMTSSATCGNASQNAGGNTFMSNPTTEPNEPKSLVIKAKKDTIVIAWAASLLILLGSCATIKHSPVLGTAAVVIMAAVVIGVAFILLTGRLPYLVLTAEGLSYMTRNFEVFSAPWQNVTGLRIGWLGTDAFNFKWTRRVFVDCHRNGKTETVPLHPPLFGMNAEELSDLLSSYHRSRVP